jgi:hypothetical protein
MLQCNQIRPALLKRFKPLAGQQIAWTQKNARRFPPGISEMSE